MIWKNKVRLFPALRQMADLSDNQQPVRIDVSAGPNPLPGPRGRVSERTEAVGISRMALCQHNFIMASQINQQQLRRLRVRIKTREQTAAKRCLT